MNINGMGGSPYMQGLHTNSMQRSTSAGGLNARQQAVTREITEIVGAMDAMEKEE